MKFLTLLKTPVLGLALAASALSAHAKELIYLVPEGVSLDGKYALAAFGDGEKDADGVYTEISFHLIQVGGNGATKIVSDVIFDWGAPYVDIRGYGPRSLWWSYGTDEERLSSEYVMVENQARKSNQHAFLRKVNGKFVKQHYNAEAYRQKASAIAFAIAQGKGYRGEPSSAGLIDWATATREANPGKEFKEINLKEEDFDLSEPLYLVLENSYYLSADDKNPNFTDTEFTVRTVVKIELDSEGNVIDSLVNIGELK